MKAGLLGTNIYEIEASWTGLEELKQAKLHLAVPTQGSEIPEGGTHLGISQDHGARRHS